MGAPSNPWAARFEPLLDADTIKERTTVEVPPLVGLKNMPIELAAKRLERALSTVFHPTMQCIAVLQRLAGAAHAHCETTYPDAHAFLAGVYAKDAPFPGFAFPVCLTGLAGVGKTELIRAFMRMQPPDGVRQVDSHHSPFALNGAWLATVHARSDPKDVLTALAGRTAKPSELVQECRKLAFRDGVPYLFADEFQFATGSGSANARVTQMLLSLAYIGIPFAYVANYSLLLRLQKRPEEDQQRLLSDPIVLLPDPWSSEDWIGTLKAQRSVAPEVMTFDPTQDAQDLHSYSAGRKRAMAKLIMIAFRAEHARAGSIDREALHRAYHSPPFARYREESEILASQAIRNAPDKKRKDLWCPIPMPDSTASKFLESTTQARSQQVAEAELRSALTGKEKKAVEEIEKTIRKRGATSGKVIALGKGKKATGEELKRNANWLRDNI